MSDPAPESMWTSFHAALLGGERWDEFVRVYTPLIRCWTAKYHFQEADGDDLAQQVFLKLTTALRRYDKERGAFRGWLHAVVRNEAMTYLRARARRPDSGSGDSDVQAVLEQQADDLAAELSGLADTRLQVLDDIQNQCSPQTWNIVTAFHAGESAAEVAARYGTTVGVVHQAVYRVKQLAKKLEKT